MISHRNIVAGSRQILRNALPLVIFIFLLFAVQSMGQSPPGFTHYDSITYAHFLEAKWDELIDEGNQALKNGFDYYYMRIRMGIAYFSLGQYRNSAKQFEHALSFNRTDSVIVNYLRKSYEWGGLEIEAANVERRFSKYPGPPKKSHLSLKNAGLYAGYTFSGNEPESSILELDGNEDIYGEINSNGDLFFTHAGLTVAPLPQAWWYNGYTYLSVERYQRFMAGNRQMRKYSYHLEQHQYYSSLTIRVKNLWYVKPAFHLIHVKDQPLKSYYSLSSDRFSFRKSDTSYNNILFSVMVIKELPSFTTDIAFSGSNLNNKV
jgi:tetratricopeptide (TPR) repeat protein